MIDKGLVNVSYAANETCVEGPDYTDQINHVTLRTKMMTKDVSNPNQIDERDNSRTKTYFTSRKRLGVLSDKVQALSDSLHRVEVYYN